MEIQIPVASDHAGFELKAALLKNFKLQGFTLLDLGPFDLHRSDYPDFADKVATRVKSGEAEYGLLICGSGQGMAIRANRFRTVRAALCNDVEMAKVSRAHNDANILCMGSRFVEVESAIIILIQFLSTPFEGGRHEARVKKLDLSTGEVSDNLKK